LLDEAIRETVGRDRYLFENNAGERTIAARLAISLQSRFKDWSVDSDYNRMRGHFPKKLDGLPEECTRYRRKGEGREALAIPDVVVHRRGPDGPNLLVLELKKTTNSDKGECDRLRLHAFRSQLQYQYGALIQCETRPRHEPSMTVIEWLA